MKVRVRCLVLLLSFAVSITTPAAGQPDTTAVPGMTDDGAAGADVECATGDDCPVLELDAFLQQVLRAGPQVQRIRLEDDRAAAELQEARGGFDPRLTSGYEYKTQEGGDKINVLRTGVDVPLNLPLSPSLIADYRRGLGSSIDPSVKTTFDGETSFGLAFEPLDAFFLDKKQATLDKARLEPRRADALQEGARNDLLLEATRAYLKWVEAQRKLEISRDLLDLATRRRVLVTRQAETGEAAAIDSTEAKLAVASRQEQVAAAEQAFRRAGVKVATFLWTPQGRPATFAFAPPASAPVPQREVADSERAAQVALDRRPELRELDVKLQQTRIQQRLARERLRPNLKLKAQVVSYENGPTDVTDLKVGFEIRQPLFFRGPRSEADEARIDAQEVSLKRDETRRKVRADIEAALIDLRQARRRVDAAEEQVSLARRLAEAEQRRFEIGESTLFLVNQRDQGLAKARKALATARADLARAHATYRWATGTIADVYGVTL